MNNYFYNEELNNNTIGIDNDSSIVPICSTLIRNSIFIDIKQCHNDNIKITFNNCYNINEDKLNNILTFLKLSTNNTEEMLNLLGECFNRIQKN